MQPLLSKKTINVSEEIKRYLDLHYSETAMDENSFIKMYCRRNPDSTEEKFIRDFSIYMKKTPTTSDTSLFLEVIEDYKRDLKYVVKPHPFSQNLEFFHPPAKTEKDQLLHNEQLEDETNKSQKDMELMLKNLEWEWETITPQKCSITNFFHKVKALIGIGFYVTVKISRWRVKYDVYVQNSYSVWDLKKKVSIAIYFFDTEHLILFFKGQELVDDKKLLGEYFVNKDSEFEADMMFVAK